MRCTLAELYDKVSPGGIIQFDDYGHWAGAAKQSMSFFRNAVFEPVSGRLIWLAGKCKATLALRMRGDEEFAKIDLLLLKSALRK